MLENVLSDVDLLASVFPYALAAAMGWYAGRLTNTAIRLRSVGRALWVIIYNAELRGVYFSAYDRAVFKKAKEYLK